MGDLSTRIQERKIELGQQPPLSKRADLFTALTNRATVQGHLRVRK